MKLNITTRMTMATEKDGNNKLKTNHNQDPNSTNFFTNPHDYVKGLRSTLNLLLLVFFAGITIPSVQGVQINDTTTGHHRCYVCLPSGYKSTSEARDILDLFPPESHQDIPDCAAFGSHNAHQFEFTCPPAYTGCLRRALGTNQILVARTCSLIKIDDCKIANSVEYCYCSGHLCNGQKSMIGQNFTGGILNAPNISVTSRGNRTSQNNRSFQSQGTRTSGESHGYWKEGETDDEDLLGPNNEDILSSADKFNNEGSGDFEGDSESNKDEVGFHHQQNNNQNPSHNSNSSHGQQSRGGNNIPASSNKGNRKGSGTQSSGAYATFNISILLWVVLATITITSANYLHVQPPPS